MVFNSPASGHTTGAAVNYNAVVAGNSLYDPALASSTQQPLGYDQLTTIYAYYRVFASKITVTLWPNANDTTGKLMLTLVPGFQSTAQASGYDYADQPHARTRADFFWYNPGKKLSNFMTTKKIWGVSNIQDDKYYAANNASPTNIWYWHININAVDGSTMTSTNRFMTKIVYWCEFSGCGMFAQS